MILITTHSDPTTGFLHIVPNNGGSVPVQEVQYFYLFIYCTFLNALPVVRSDLYRSLSSHFKPRGQEKYSQLVIMW